MWEYRVRRFESGRWDHQDPRSIRANSPAEAAAMVCGGPVGGRGHRVCAEVWPSGGLPSDLATFYHLDGR